MLRTTRMLILSCGTQLELNDFKVWLWHLRNKRSMLLLYLTTRTTNHWLCWRKECNCGVTWFPRKLRSHCGAASMIRISVKSMWLKMTSCNFVGRVVTVNTISQCSISQCQQRTSARENANVSTKWWSRYTTSFTSQKKARRHFRKGRSIDKPGLTSHKKLF